MPSRIEALAARRAAERRAEALPRAIAALEALRERGVDAGVIGSLARDRMRAHSDVDFMILDEGVVHWNEIIAIIERHTRPLPINVVFLDSVRPAERPWFLRDFKRERELRSLATPAGECEGRGRDAVRVGALPSGSAA